MKKILVLTMMVMLVASMSVMASDVTVSGETLFEWYQDMDTIYEGNGDGELKATAVVDDYNTSIVLIEAVAGDMMLKDAYFTTALGKYFGVEDMGVTITLNWGIWEWANAEYAKITGYENEAVWDAKARNWAFNVDVGIMDIVNIEAAMAPEPGVSEMMIGAYGGMDPVHVEVYYTQEGNALDMGIVGIGANFAMDIMPDMYAFELGLAFKYNMDSDALDGDQYALGFGLVNTIMEMVYVNIGIAGTDDAILGLLWFELGVDYESMVGVDVGVGMIMDDSLAPETLDEVDFSVWTKVGAAKFRIGYVMVTEDNGLTGYYEGLNAPGDADFDPAISGGCVYFSGDLDF